MNKYENMEIVALDDVTDIYNSIGIELMTLENKNDYIAVFAKRDLICELFEMMITDGCSFRYANCDFMDEMLKDKVYMMLIHQDYSVSIEPAYNKRGIPIMHDAKTAFIFMDDCKQDVIDYCVNSDKNVVLFDYEDECCGCECCGNEELCEYCGNGECCACGNEVAIESDGDMHGFSVNRSDDNGYSSYSFYSTDRNLTETMAKLFR